jgi:hypothetical protein
MLNCYVENCHICNNLYSLNQLISNCLNKKYGMSKDLLNVQAINQLLAHKPSHIVAAYNDYLFYDDSTEHFRDFTHITLTELRCEVSRCVAANKKVFPNYAALDEKHMMHRNIYEKKLHANNESSIILIDKYSDWFEDKKFINSIFTHQLDNDQWNISNSMSQQRSLLSSFWKETEEVQIDEKQALAALLADSISFGHKKTGGLLHMLRNIRNKHSRVNILAETGQIDAIKRNIYKMSSYVQFISLARGAKQMVIKLRILKASYRISYGSIGMLRSLCLPKIYSKARWSEYSILNTRIYMLNRQGYLEDLHNKQMIPSKLITQS